MLFRHGFLIAGLLVVSCAKPKTDSPTTTTGRPDTTSPTTTAPVVVSFPTVNGPTPDSLVRDLYREHDAKRSPFFQTLDRALVGRYFTRKLTRLIWNDVVGGAGEESALQADPLYDAQDTDIARFQLGTPVFSDDRKQAELPIMFTNMKQPVRLRFSLKQEQHRWKIDDIAYADGRRLADLLTPKQGK
jgi:hypothetical protein